MARVPTPFIVALTVTAAAATGVRAGDSPLYYAMGNAAEDVNDGDDDEARAFVGLSFSF